MGRSFSLAFLWAVGLTGFACGSGDARCGPDQVLVEGTCRCAPGFELDERHCVAASDDAADAGARVDAAAPDATSAPPEDAGAEAALERPCTDHNECGADAPFCDTHFYDMCLIDDCTLAPESCPTGWECCDFSRFGLEETLCVYVDDCPTR